MFRITIRDLLWLMVVVGMGICLFQDRMHVARLNAQVVRSQAQLRKLDFNYGRLWKPLPSSASPGALSSRERVVRDCYFFLPLAVFFFATASFSTVFGFFGADFFVDDFFAPGFMVAAAFFIWLWLCR